MPGPGVPIERLEPGHHLGPEGIQMEIADQLQEIGLLLHHDGPVPVLEEMAHALVAPIEATGVPREERAHTPGQRSGTRAEQEVGVIREERPGVDGECPLLGQPGDPADEVRPVGVVAEDGRPLDPPHHHVVQGPGGVEAGMARHGTVTIPQADTDCNVPY